MVMGLGSTAKKIQAVAEHAEDLVKQVGELRDRVLQLEEKVKENNESMQELHQELREQRGLLEALAEKEGVDIEDEDQIGTES